MSNTSLWSNKKITVLGLGRSGISTATYLAGQGAQVVLSEGLPVSGEKQEQVNRLQSLGIKVETGGHSDDALRFGDLIVISPGIPPTSKVVESAKRFGKDIVCDIEIAWRSTKAPVVAITGTNGKSTTSALISHILQSAGYKAPACGNIGVPILDQLEKNPDYLVAEVSSFQSYYTTDFAPQVAVWLNLTPDHIDWHGGLDEYIDAKRKLFARQKPYHYAVLNHDDPLVIAQTTDAEVFPFSVDTTMEDALQAAYMERDYLWYRFNGGTERVCRKSELNIIGKHNLENALAAVSAAAVLGVSREKIAEGLTSFTALEHRLELAGTIDGITFYNDSKATNPTSTIKALEAFEQQKIVLIAGGRDKGTSLSDLTASIKRHVAEVILLGEAKERFARALADAGYSHVHSVDSLEDAIELGVIMKKGPVVLSPACASFDMFKDYEERGRVFKNLVRTRLEKVGSTQQR